MCPEASHEKRYVRHILPSFCRLPKIPESDPASGLVTVALSLARCQAGLGHRVEVVGYAPERKRWSGNQAGLQYLTHPGWHWARFRRWDFRWLAPMFAASMLSKPADFAQVHSDASLLLLPLGKHRVFHIHTPIPSSPAPGYERLLKRSDAVVCCSEYIYNQLINAFPSLEEQTFVVHNGVDLKPYGAADVESFRRRWVDSEDALIVLCVGALVPEKGVEFAIQAVSQSVPTFPNVRLVIVGSSTLWGGMDGREDSISSYERGLRTLAKERPVSFAGKLPRAQMPAAFLAADVVVVPSNCEDSSPLVVYEAMAAGKPVVASGVGGIPEILVDGETGFLVPPGDPEAIARAIAGLARDAALRRQMGLAAQQRARGFTWDIAVRKIESVYEHVLRQKSKDAKYV